MDPRGTLWAPIVLDGHQFSSISAMKFYAELMLMQKRGWVSDVCVNVPLPLSDGTSFVCDFVFTNRDGTTSRIAIPAIYNQRFYNQRLKAEREHDLIIDGHMTYASDQRQYLWRYRHRRVRVA